MVFATFLIQNGTRENEQVVGELVLFKDDVAKEKVGKQRYEMVQRAWVIYRVPEGEVMFRVNPGLVYPDRAILYRNSSK